MSMSTGKNTAADGTRWPGGKCPFCGASESHPSDSDSWCCLNCGRDYPLLAFKCQYEGCWEFKTGDGFCEQHKPVAGST